MDIQVRYLIEDAGAVLLYTAPFSPDLNPIEKMFNLYKAYLKKYHIAFGFDWIATHWKALATSVTKDKAIQEFRKCGVPYSKNVLTSNERKAKERQIIVGTIIIFMILLLIEDDFL